MVSYSQFGEDAWIKRNLQVPEMGYYVDIGAAHPTKFNNTAMLHESGWSGLCVEPVAERVIQLIDHGRDVVAKPLTPDGEDVVFHQYDATDLSGINKIDEKIDKRASKDILMSSISVSDLLTITGNDIQFASIDTEGTELDLLESFIQERVFFDILVIEYNTYARRDRSQDIKACAKKSGYKLQHKTKANYIFTYDR